jgi:hypothetical protein
MNTQVQLPSLAESFFVTSSSSSSSSSTTTTAATTTAATTTTTTTTTSTATSTATQVYRGSIYSTPVLETFSLSVPARYIGDCFQLHCLFF